MRKGIAHQVALGGILAALAMAIMLLGGLIPIATFICPMLCILICSLVYKKCGRRIGWAWYAAVAFMTALFAPDKEGAMIFLFLGYYPMLKVCFDKRRRMVAILYKTVYFNSVIILLYMLLLKILGLSELISEYSDANFWLGAASVFMGNIAFFLLDFVLNRVLFVRRINMTG